MPEANVATMKVRRPRAMPDPSAPTTDAKPKATKVMPKNVGNASRAKANKEAMPNRFTGKTTGLRVKDFQNQTLAKNFRAKLTDEALAAAWRAEFPNAVAYTIEHVAGVRGVWNHGLHDNDAPDKPLPPYGSDGMALPIRTHVKKAFSVRESAAPAKVKKMAAAASAAAEAVAQKTAKKAAKKVAETEE